MQPEDPLNISSVPLDKGLLMIALLLEDSSSMLMVSSFNTNKIVTEGQGSFSSALPMACASWR